MRPFSRVLLVPVVALLGYLLLWPIEVSPVAWEPPQDQGFSGLFASNGKLAKAEWLAHELPGPEGISRDARGHLLTGTLDGRVVAISQDGKVQTLAQTGGRPLSVRPLLDGSLVLTDAYKGLLQLSQGKVSTLVSSYHGEPLRFVDDLDVLPDGRVVFTNATQRFGLAEYELDALEHSGTGAVYVYDPAQHSTDLLHGDLQFANGVAASGDGSFVLVNETWAYRVRRIFLKGPKAGHSEVVIDNLPGFPDNITYDRMRNLFWVALASPRDPGLDLLGPLPALRRMVGRLPKSMRPKPQHHAMALAIHPNGKVAYFFDDPRPESYSPITSVFATEDALFFGSFQHHGFARIPLRALGVPVAHAAN
jgi:sugar lactone lactonase YvrE